MKSLDTLKLDLTNACNEQCFFCPYHGDKGEVSRNGERHRPIEMLSHDDVSKVLSSLKDGGEKIRRVKLSGSGEATLHPQFGDIIRTIKSTGIFIKLITNGTTLGRNAELIRANIDDLTVSVHGNEQVHNRIVGLRTAFQRVTKGLNILLQSPNDPPHIQLSYVMNGENLETTEDIMRLSKAFNIPVVFYFDFNPSDHQPVNIPKLLEAVRKIRAQGFQVSPALDEADIRRFFSEGNFLLDPHSCDHVEREIEILASGDVYVCRSEVWGNIHHQDILTILRGEGRHKFLRIIDGEAKSKCGLNEERCDRCCYQNPLTSISQ